MRVTRSMPEFMLAGALLAVFAVGVEAQTGPPVAPVRPVFRFSVKWNPSVFR